jgi:hypothetical protein
MEQVEASIERYPSALETAEALEAAVRAAQDKQISLTDPDARSWVAARD